MEKHLVKGNAQEGDFTIDDQAGNLHQPQSSASHCIETVNANTGLPTLKERLEGTKALVVVSQETGITEDVKGDASSWALASGWHMLHTPAESRGLGHSSAGVVIFAKVEVGIRDLRILMKHRMISVKLDLPGWPEVDLVAAYFKVAEGLGDVNSALWKAAKIHLQDRQHFIMGADWNMKPHFLEATGLPRLLSAVLAVPRQYTCRTDKVSNHIDYFRASAAFAGVMDTIGGV